MPFLSPPCFGVLSFSWSSSGCCFAQVTLSCHVRRPFSAVSLWGLGLVSLCRFSPVSLPAGSSSDKAKHP